MDIACGSIIWTKHTTDFLPRLHALLCIAALFAVIVGTKIKSCPAHVGHCLTFTPVWLHTLDEDPCRRHRTRYSDVVRLCPLSLLADNSSLASCRRCCRAVPCDRLFRPNNHGRDTVSRLLLAKTAEVRLLFMSGESARMFYNKLLLHVAIYAPNAPKRAVVCDEHECTGRHCFVDANVPGVLRSGCFLLRLLVCIVCCFCRYHRSGMSGWPSCAWRQE